MDVPGNIKMFFIGVNSLWGCALLIILIFNISNIWMF